MGKDPSIVRRTEAEHETIVHIRNAVRDAIKWRTDGAQDLSRKISSVRFVTQSFQRYLERMLALEEHDGYMATVCDSKPHLEPTVQSLRQDHDRFRGQIQQLMPRIERVTVGEPDVFRGICDELLDLVDGVTNHNAREAALLQDAFLQDEGGEG